MIVLVYRPWDTANTEVDICFLVENGNKQKNETKFAQTFFISHLAALKLTLDHLQGGNVTHSKLITTLFQIQPEVHRDPCDEVGFQSLIKRISRIRKRNIPIFSVMYCAITLPESVPETIDHRLASFFLRNYR